MQSTEFTKPITTESLLGEFKSRFNQTMDLSTFTKEDLEDVANKIRTKIHEITSNTHFGHELKNADYQKSQMMLDIVNQAIKEYGVRYPHILCGDVGTSIRKYENGVWSFDSGWVDHVKTKSPRWDAMAIPRKVVSQHTRDQRQISTLTEDMRSG